MQVIAPPGPCWYWPHFAGGSSPLPSTLLFAAARTPASVPGPDSPVPTCTPALGPAGLAGADRLADTDGLTDGLAFGPLPESALLEVPPPAALFTATPAAAAPSTSTAQGRSHLAGPLRPRCRVRPWPAPAGGCGSGGLPGQPMAVPAPGGAASPPRQSPSLAAQPAGPGMLAAASPYPRGSSGG
jgi:hypothetical protein